MISGIDSRSQNNSKMDVIDVQDLGLSSWKLDRYWFCLNVDRYSVYRVSGNSISIFILSSKMTLYNTVVWFDSFVSF
jgi:hypothetical protein